MPFSVVVPVPVDSEYCVRHHVGQESSVAQNDGSTMKFITPSKQDHMGHGFLPNQPYMYVPSTSVLMLCGNPPGEMGDLRREDRTSPISDLRNMHESSQPDLKPISGSSNDAPISLVLPKVRRTPVL